MKINKDHLSPEIIEKQKIKGTYDSPCMSICDYAGDYQECQTCRMRKTEKAQWKVGDADIKADILLAIKNRLS